MIARAAEADKAAKVLLGFDPSEIAPAAPGSAEIDHIFRRDVPGIKLRTSRHEMLEQRQLITELAKGGLAYVFALLTANEGINSLRESRLRGRRSGSLQFGVNAKQETGVKFFLLAEPFLLCVAP